MMNRRQLMGVTIGSAGLAALPLRSRAQALYQEGTHYQRLPANVPTADPTKIEVVEVFWYGCPHCFRFEPQIEAWVEQKPDNVSFVQLPGAGGRWTLGAVAFYVAKKLDVVGQTHAKLFDYIHVDRQSMNDLSALGKFYERYGIDHEQFTAAVNSFDVKMNVQRAIELMKRYQVTGVPALIVNGKYKTNSLSVVDYLIQRESA